MERIGDLWWHGNPRGKNRASPLPFLFTRAEVRSTAQAAGECGRVSVAHERGRGLKVSVTYPACRATCLLYVVLTYHSEIVSVMSCYTRFNTRVEIPTFTSLYPATFPYRSVMGIVRLFGDSLNTPK